ncbi:hypothetical protein OEZ85_011328 [Tetradesmus obliquus]|uniref:CCAAT-binding factor domain-containing protein n=1 Tax=Tetradesmus obliquus TaxID=3088 RepID=A0ABY8TQ07_TETOB|nr:hypothetical protein OEZ85_011328 [Tetradesmus obliquus]
MRHANNAVVLLQCLQEPLQEPLARGAMQALKLFFVEQHDEGQLQSHSSSSSAAKRHKTNPAAAAAAASSSQPEQQQQQTPEELYAAWLSRQYAAYIHALLQLLGSASASPSLQVSALAALMECVRHEAGPAAFSNRLFGRVISCMLTGSGVQPEVYSLLFTKYLHCLDVRFYTLAAITRLAQQHAVRGETAAAAAAGGDSGAEDEEAAVGGGSSRGSADVSRTMFDVLSHIAPIVPPKQPQQKDQQQQQQSPLADLQSWCGAAEAGLVQAAGDSNASAKARRKRKQQQQEEPGAAAAAPAAAAAAWANLKLQQRCYGDAWLAFLRTDLPHDIYRKVLLKLHSEVLPALVNPLLLSDFLSHSLDRGGLEGMLALNGIFRLVTRHGLEYPAFYARLYGLLTPAAFMHKQRVQFFQLADIFLSSSMVPAYTAAAFAKKFGRLALRAPPAGAMLALGFIHNIIRRHPSCMVLLHKPAAAAAGGGDEDSDEAAAAAGRDVYDEAQPDPAKSRAVESSLWELAALRNHYCPQVASMCSVLDKDLANRVRSSELDLVPLLPASYASLMGQELGRKLRKGVATAFYAAPPQGLWDAALLGEELQGWDLSLGAEEPAQQ